MAEGPCQPPPASCDGPAAPGPAKRRKHDKVKSGCNTCKQRRVKCDEAKPECRRCSSTDRQCGGYQPIPKPPKPFQVKAWRHATVDSLTHLVSARPDVQHPQDVRSLEYLVQQTMPFLVGFYPTPPWANALLAGAEADAILRHGLLALSQCHRARSESAAPVDQQPSDPAVPLTGLRHYNRAIQLLRNALSENTLSPARVRLASLPLILYECLQRNIPGMKMHLQNSMALEDKSLSPSPSPSASVPLPTTPASAPATSPSASVEDPAADFLARFSLFYTLHGRPRSDLLTQQLPQPRIAARYDSTDEMHTTYDAQMQMTNISIRSLQVVRACTFGLVPDGFDVRVVVEGIRSELRAWAARYRRFEERYPVQPQDDPDQDLAAGRAMLWAFHTLAQVSVEQYASHIRGTFAAFDEPFRRVVDTLEFVLVARREGREGRDRDVKMAPVDGGLIMPLMFVALKCRQRETRRRAIALLRQCPRSEGVWEADESILIAQTVVDYEEGTLRPGGTSRGMVLDVDTVEQGQAGQPGGRDKMMVLWIEGEGSDDFALAAHPAYWVRVRAVKDRPGFLRGLMLDALGRRQQQQQQER